jgi:hypothetical protein
LNRFLLASALFALSGAACAGLDNINSDSLHLHKRTLRTVSVVTAIEGTASEVSAAYGAAMKRWVEAGLTQNGFIIDPNANSAPDLRFGGYCGRAVNGCSLKIYVARDLWYEQPDGAVYRLPSRDVAEDKVSKETDSYSSDEMYPLFVQMVTKFVQRGERSTPAPAVAAR